jgi:hypothetical protein
LIQFWLGSQFVIKPQVSLWFLFQFKNYSRIGVVYYMKFSTIPVWQQVITTREAVWFHIL